MCVGKVNDLRLVRVRMCVCEIKEPTGHRNRNEQADRKLYLARLPSPHVTNSNVSALYRGFSIYAFVLYNS